MNARPRRAALALATSTAAAAPIDDAARMFGRFVRDPGAARELREHLGGRAAEVERRLRAVGDSRGCGEALVLNVVENLNEKAELQPPFPLSADEIRRTVIDYEAFKLETFVTSGVFPKRYFGYFDGKHDTAPYEKRLRETVSRVVRTANAYQRERGRPLRISDIEVAVTFVAEGGAIALRERQDLLAGMHPVLDVGLDDVASGFGELPGLQARVDREAGTDLGGLVARVERGAARLPLPTLVPERLRWLRTAGDEGPYAYLRRTMTFEEALAGTALMYLWEKEIAARKMEQEGLGALHQRPLDEQFVIASLVYNSGILHAPERWEMLGGFATGAWVHGASEANAKKRWRLNVQPPRAALRHVCGGAAYPEQPTAWLAAYHVLQRYGAFVALRRFTGFFAADGSFAP